MKEVALVLKRIGPTRFILALFTAVLGLCVNCRADSLSVYQQYNFAQYSGYPILLQSDQNGITLSDPFYATVDFRILDRGITVPALPKGAIVTSATFSLTALSGTLEAGNGHTSIVGTSQAQLGYIGATNLTTGTPCLPPDCAPAIATISVAYQNNLGDNCFYQELQTCFTTPAAGDFNLLSLGLPSAFLADGFTISNGETGDYLWGHGASIDTVLYPGFNSSTAYSFGDVGPQVAESVLVNYTLPRTVPEPSTPMLLIPGILALAALKLKRAA